VRARLGVWGARLWRRALRAGFALALGLGMMIGTTDAAQASYGGGCPSAPYFGSIDGFNFEFFGCTAVAGT
jgi:hypothetical protein